MARIIRPSITIDGTEYKCMSRTVELVPGDYRNFCERDWTASIEVELTYGATGTWTELKALEDAGVPVEIVLSPSDGTVSADNPAATFNAEIKAIPFMMGATRGERQYFTLELMSDDEPVFTTAP